MRNLCFWADKRNKIIFIKHIDFFDILNKKKSQHILLVFVGCFFFRRSQCVSRKDTHTSHTFFNACIYIYVSWMISASFPKMWAVLGWSCSLSLPLAVLLARSLRSHYVPLRDGLHIWCSLWFNGPTVISRRASRKLQRKTLSHMGFDTTVNIWPLRSHYFVTATLLYCAVHCIFCACCLLSHVSYILCLAPIIIL